MLIFSKILPVSNQMEVYNLTSLYEGYQRLRLIPPFEIFDNNSNEFDLEYMNWIFNNPEAKEDLLSLMFKIRSGIDVCILIIDNDKFNIIYESLQKLISQRYGYIINIVNTPEDWDYCTNIGPRNAYHIYYLDMDLLGN